MAWHAVAHGADAILYWQWRSALGGQEQMHGTLVDQSGEPRPFYEEARQLGMDFAAVSELLAGSEVQASVAMLNDYDSLWSIQWQPHHRDFDYVEHFTQYYRPLAALNVPVDVLSARALTNVEKLAGYRLVIAPALLIQNQATVDALRAYVSQGGHLVLTARSGMKDEYNALLPQRQPGGLGEIAGVEVEDFYALQEPVPVTGTWFKGQSNLWAERLARTGKKEARVIARYRKSNGWLDDQIAVSVNGFGTGLVYYVGVCLDETAQQAFLARVLKIARVTTIVSPPGIEIFPRASSGNGELFYIVINHNSTECSISMPWPSFEHLGRRSLSAEFYLPAYEVMVLSPSQK
jgi:beta-galactosidase